MFVNLKTLKVAKTVVIINIFYLISNRELRSNKSERFGKKGKMHVIYEM